MRRERVTVMCTLAGILVMAVGLPAVGDGLSASKSTGAEAGPRVLDVTRTGVTEVALGGGPTAILEMLIPAEYEDSCFNDMEPVQIEVHVKNIDPSDQGITGVQFFLEWEPGCMCITDIQEQWGFQYIEVIDCAAGRADFAMNDLVPHFGDDIFAAVITVVPVDGSCFPCLTYRPIGPSGIPNKVGIPDSPFEIAYYPPGDPREPDSRLTLIPAAGDCLLGPDGEPLHWDLQAPSIECPPSVQVPITPGECTAYFCPDPPPVEDDISAPEDIELTCTRADGEECCGFYPLGVCTEVTWTAEDECGNVSTCTFEVCVPDNQPPVVTCPDDIINHPMDPGECHATIDPGMATAVDPEDGEITDVTCERSDGLDCFADPYPEGCTTLRWCATDSCGETGCCSQLICVVDDQPPTIECPPDIEVDNDPGQCSAIVDPGFATCEDNCECIVTWCRSDYLDLHDPYPVGCTTITWYALDNENIVECVQQVCVNDVEAPVCECPADPEPVDAGEGCEAQVDIPVPDCYDNCAIESQTCAREDGKDCFDPYPVGAMVVTWTTTDSSGNETICEYTVTVIDDTPPEVYCNSGDIEVCNDDGECGAVVEIPLATCSDNCGFCEVTCERSDGLSIDDPFFPVGTTTITCTATDGFHEVSCSYSVTVHDCEDPVIPNCPDDIAVSADPDECGAIVEWEPVVCDDNCPDCVVSCDHEPGEFFPVGGTYVECVADDGYGNYANCEFMVTVEDDTPPVIENCPEDITVCNDPEQCGAYVDWTEPTARDACGVAMFKASHQPGSWFEVGTTEVCYTAIDIYGNESQCCFTVTVEDCEDPVIECPEDVTWYAPLGTCCVNIPLEEIGRAHCWDNCDPCHGCNPMATRSDGRGMSECWPVGETIVTWVCIDDAGNAAWCLQTVTVRHGFCANVELRGGAEELFAVNNGYGGYIQKPITFTLFDCEAALQIEICEEMPFLTDNGLALNHYVEVDVTAYPEICDANITCVTARDTLHTLRRTLDLDGRADGQGGPDCVLFDFTGDERELISGNLNDDCFIDVEDFAIYQSELETCGWPAATCEWVGIHPELDGDGCIDDPSSYVLPIDRILMGDAFFGVSEVNCCEFDPICGEYATDGPRTSIPVFELLQKGINGYAADLDGNGVVDLADVEAAWGAAPEPPPRFESSRKFDAGQKFDRRH